MDVRVFRLLDEERRAKFVSMLSRLQTPAPGVKVFVDMPREELEAFIRTCHATFQQLQVEILAELLAIEAQRRTLTKRSAELHRLDSWHWLVRKLADSIAWMLIGPDNLWIARRLCKFGWGEEALTSLTHSNYESVVEFVTNHNAADPDSFALMCDITSFVHLGDALMREKTGLRIVELKKGAINEMLMERLESDSSPEELRKELTASHPPAVVSQLERMLRQHVRLENTTTLLNTGKGVDQQGRATRISEATHELPSFFDLLADLFGRIDAADWAIEHIDGCLYVGLYKGMMRHPSVFGTWLRGMNFDGPVVNYLDCVRNPLASPPPLVPIIQQHVERLVTGELVLQMALDMEPYIKLGNELGVPMQWLSRKQTADRLRGSLQKELFKWKNRAIGLGEGFQSTLGWGLLMRTFFGFTRPAAALWLTTQPL